MTTPALAIPLMDRVWARVNKNAEGGHWLWEGSFTKAGYPQVYVGPKHPKGTIVKYVHVLVYEEIVGPVPEGLELDHMCEVTACVRPFWRGDLEGHVQPDTHQNNIRYGKGWRR